jgi:hypothetical protein
MLMFALRFMPPPTYGCKPTPTCTESEADPNGWRNSLNALDPNGPNREEEPISCFAASAPRSYPRPELGNAVLFSSVPAVLMMKPSVESLLDHVTAWLSLAMASTLLDNFTILGSIANLVVVRKVASREVISFLDYFSVGALLKVITLVIDTLWMWL